jgi:hypothetical protein
MDTDAVSIYSDFKEDAEGIGNCIFEISDFKFQRGNLRFERGGGTPPATAGGTAAATGGRSLHKTNFC